MRASTRVPTLLFSNQTFFTLNKLGQSQRLLDLPSKNFAEMSNQKFEAVTAQMDGRGKSRISTKTLCDITGTRYYMSNEEINFQPGKIVKVFDENDVLIGEISFGEAQESARAAKKDIVLRNDKIEPPVCKIMNYKMELMKKLFKKLGTQTNESEVKFKTLRLSTTIALHDLENKKRKAIEFLKGHANLKLYMKVNIYDEENVQKGKLMLMNIAEDLKEYCKIKVAPTDENFAKKEEQAKGKGEKKPQKLNEIKKAADQQLKKKDQMKTVDDFYDDDDFEGKSNHLYMELQSTVAFKEIDIDKMLQHTTLDDFMRGLYTKAAGIQTNAPGEPSLMEQIMSAGQTKRTDSSIGGPQLRFEDEKSVKETSEELRRQALQNLRERRMRQKQSQIFNAADQKVKEQAAEIDETPQGSQDLDRIDLTKSQLKSTESEEKEQLDEFDLLEAKVDSRDLRTADKIQKLHQEIELEKTKIKIKALFRYSFSEANPMRINE